MTNQVLRALRPAIFGEITWGSKDNAPRICQELSLESRIRQLTDPNSEVTAFTYKIDIAIGQLEFDLDFRMRREEFR